MQGTYILYTHRYRAGRGKPMKKLSLGVLVIDTNWADLPTQPNLAAAILMQAAHLLTSPNLGGVMTSNYKDARAKVFHRFRALNHTPWVEPPNSNSIKKELKIERILPIDCIWKEMGL